MSVTTSPSTDSTVHERFRQLRDELATEILEADERIDGALIALVAGEHMAQIGAPGTAKTELVDRLMLRISDARFFSELMRKTMPPETVFGAVSIIGLKEDRWHYVTNGFMPEADVALIDEFARTSDTILNGLLTILKERRFKNGAEMMQVPLSTAFLCANSLPTGEAEHDLEAFWDRVLLRFEVKPPVDPATWRAIARRRLPASPDPVLSWDDVLTAKAAAQDLAIAEKTWDALEEIRIGLLNIGITITGRRYGQAQMVAAAWAWLQGAPEVLPTHCDKLTHALWDTPEQRVEVDKVVYAVTSPGAKEAIQLSDDVQDLVKQVDDALALPADRRMAHLNELHAKTAAQQTELVTFVDGASGRALRTGEAALRQLISCQLKLMREGYGVDLAHVAALNGPGR